MSHLFFSCPLALVLLNSLLLCSILFVSSLFFSFLLFLSQLNSSLFLQSPLKSIFSSCPTSSLFLDSPFSIFSSCLYFFLTVLFSSQLFSLISSPLISVCLCSYTLFSLWPTLTSCCMFSVSCRSPLSVCLCGCGLRNRDFLWLAGCVLKGPSLRLCTEKEREGGRARVSALGSEQRKRSVGVLFCDGRAGKRGERAIVCLRHTRSAISPFLLPSHACSPLPQAWTTARLLSLEHLKKKEKKENQNIPFTHTLHTGRAWSSSPRWWWVSSFCFSCLVSFSFYFCSWNKRWKGKASGCSYLRLWKESVEGGRVVCESWRSRARERKWAFESESECVDSVTRDADNSSPVPESCVSSIRAAVMTRNGVMKCTGWVRKLGTSLFPLSFFPLCSS